MATKVQRVMYFGDAPAAVAKIPMINKVILKDHLEMGNEYTR